MEGNFDKIIARIKEETVDPEKTKKYILVIKRLLERVYGAGQEQESSQALEDFLADYQSDLEFRGNAEQVFEGMFRHCAYKRLITDFKKDRRSFNLIIEEAKKMEEADRMSDIIADRDIHKAMVAIVRAIVRNSGTIKGEDVFNHIEAVNQITVADLRKRMIEIIRTVTMMLEEYGFIDEYIKVSNSELEQIGLNELQYAKRNPIPDEQYVNGKKVKDVEDIGVIDALSEEELQKIPIEDLTALTLFWEAKYIEERMDISRAMATIKSLGLWDTIIDGTDEEIQGLDEAKVNGALKKDLALSYLCDENIVVTDRMKQQYQKFLSEEGMTSSLPIEGEIKEMLPEALNLRMASRDIAVLEYLVIYMLQIQELKTEAWGILREAQEKEEQAEDRGITLAVESRNFRGPIIMAMSTNAFRGLFKTDGSDFPEYTRQLDETYCSIISKICLPSNQFFRKMVKKAYEGNKQSALLANLAGKKVIPNSGETR